jgi:hypothetical protein
MTRIIPKQGFKEMPTTHKKLKKEKKSHLEPVL